MGGDVLPRNAYLDGAPDRIDLQSGQAALHL